MRTSLPLPIFDLNHNTSLPLRIFDLNHNRKR
jgi:hypothetical protein